MAEYTYEDIIMDPEDPRLEGAIGKECYFGDYPTDLLDDATGRNSSICLSNLKSVNKDESYPFADIEGHAWVLIIIKKEEPKKYVPFENGQEFFNSYLSVESRLEKEDYFLSNHGIWLKDKTSKAYYMVTKIWDIGDDSDEISWKELLEHYTFLDDSPCGKKVEE